MSESSPGKKYKNPFHGKSLLVVVWNYFFFWNFTWNRGLKCLPIQVSVVIHLYFIHKLITWCPFPNSQKFILNLLVLFLILLQILSIAFRRERRRMSIWKTVLKPWVFIFLERDGVFCLFVLLALRKYYNKPFHHFPPKSCEFCIESPLQGEDLCHQVVPSVLRTFASNNHIRLYFLQLQTLASDALKLLSVLKWSHSEYLYNTLCPRSVVYASKIKDLNTRDRFEFSHQSMHKKQFKT